MVEKITYKDKTAIQNKPNIPKENKVTDEDLNEIKRVVNINADEIEKQNELIDKYKSNLINLEVTGESINVKDSSNLPSVLEILGNAKQEVREGHNVYKSEDYTLHEFASGIPKVVTDKVKINSKDLNNINFTTSASGYFGVLSSPTIIKNTETKYISLKLNGGNNDIRVGLINKKENGYESIEVKSPLANQKYEWEYTNNTGSDVNLCLGIWTGNTNKYMIDVSEIMITNESNKPYEAYGKTPTLEIESQVQTVGSNVNLFDKDKEVDDFYYNDTGTTTSDLVNRFINQEYTKNSKNITISFSKKIGDAYVRICEYRKDRTFIKRTLINTNKTFTFDDNTTSYIISTDNLITKYFENLKIEQGEKSTSYSPFNMGSVRIDVVNKNFFDIKKYPFIDRVSYSRTGEQNSWTGYCGIQNYFPVKENTEYTFSNNLNKPIYYGLVFYNKDKQVIYAIINNTTTFITPKRCEYIRFAIESDILPTWCQIEIAKQATEKTEHQSQSYILPIQKPMLKIGENQDRFIKRDSKWYEEHNIGKIIFDGEENKFTSKSAIDINNLFQTFAIPNIKKPIDNNTKAGLLSNYFIDNTANTLYFQNKIGISGRNGGDISIGFGLESGIDTLDKANQFLKEKNNSGNPVTAYYPLITPELLECTEKQSQILEELNAIETYFPVTNINTDSIAILNLKYIADTKLYIDNEINGLKTNLSTINELLSSKTTSALLLDNMQKDLESEVI